MTLDRSSILRFSSLPTETVEVPEWGGTVRLRGLTAGQRDQYELAVRADSDEGRPRNVRGRLVSLCVVDEAGERVFSDSDASELSALPAKPIDRLFTAAARLSGLGPDDVEELEKNSGTPRRDDSSSA